MSEKRRGLGRGIGALIPPAPNQSGGTAAPARSRPVDVFFPNGPGGRQSATRPDDAVPRETSEHGAAEHQDAAAPRSDHTVEGDVSRGTQAGEQGAPGARGGSDDPRDTTPPVGTMPTAAAAAEQAAAAGPRGTGSSDGAPALDADLGSSPDDGRAPDRPAAPGDGGAPTDGLVPVPGARFAELPVASIRPNSRQPRQVFDQDAMDELVHSVREIGVLQPVVVRPLPGPDADGARYELIMGERRWRASTEAGLEVVPAIIRATDDDVMLRDALLENLHRSELNPLEEAAAYQQLLDDFGCTQDELSRRIGRSRPQISNTIRLLRLPPAVQRRVAAGVLSAGHARALLSLDDTVAAERLAQRVVSEGLSVRAVEEIVASRQGTTPRPSAPRAGRHLPLLDDVASRLSDRLDTRVKVALGRNRGRVTVEFATVEDLDRILSVLDPGGPGVARPSEHDARPGADDSSDDPAVAVGRPEEQYDH